VRETPEPLSTYRQDASIPKTLEAVVMRCLEKDPASRFQDMRSLSEALQQAVGSTQIPSLHGDVGARLPSSEFVTEVTQPPLPETERPKETFSGKMRVFERQAPLLPFLTEQAKAVSKPLIVRQSLGSRRRQLVSLSAMLLLVSGLIIGWCIVTEGQSLETATGRDARHTREAFMPSTHTEASFATVPWFQFPMSLTHEGGSGQADESTELDLSSGREMSHRKKRYRKRSQRARRGWRRLHKRRRARRSRLSVLYRNNSAQGKKRSSISRTVDPFGSGK
jgi:hypothetical protein